MMHQVINCWRTVGVGLIQFIGSKTFDHTSASAQVVSLTDLKDSNNNDFVLLPDDIVIVSISRTSTSNLGGLYPTAPTYIDASGDLYANSNWDCNFGVSYRFMGGTPDTTVTIPGTGNSGCAVTIFAMRGVNTVTPLDVAVTTATGTGTPSPNPPAITPVTTGALITVHGAGGGDPVIAPPTPADLSAVTNHFRSVFSNGATSDSSSGTGIKTDWAGGSFDPAAWSGGTDVLGSWCACTIAWRPA